MAWMKLRVPMAPVGSGGERSFSSSPCQVGLATGLWELVGAVVAGGWDRAAEAAAAAEYRS